MATTAFEDSESLGEAWHAVGGYGNMLEALANGHMRMLLQTNPEFASFMKAMRRRCSCPESLRRE